MISTMRTEIMYDDAVRAVRREISQCVNNERPNIKIILLEIIESPT